MVKASVSDIKGILQRNNITNVSPERVQMCRIGCELGYLYPSDVAFIADSHTSIGDATRRMSTRRKESI